MKKVKFIDCIIDYSLSFDKKTVKMQFPNNDMWKSFQKMVALGGKEYYLNVKFKET